MADQNIDENVFSETAGPAERGRNRANAVAIRTIGLANSQFPLNDNAGTAFAVNTAGALLSIELLALEVADNHRMAKRRNFSPLPCLTPMDSTVNNPKDKLSNTNLVTVCSLTDSVEAELVKNTLVDHQIECQLSGEHQAGFTGTLEIGVVVLESDVEKAKEILQIHHPKLFGTG